MTLDEEPRPARDRRQEGETKAETMLSDRPRHSTAVVLKGWSPFLLASVFIFAWGMPAVGRASQRRVASAASALLAPARSCGCRRSSPVPTPEDAIADLNIIPTPGTAVFASGVLVGASSGHVSPSSHADVRAHGRSISYLRSWPSASWWGWPSSLAMPAWTRFSG